MPRNFTSKLLVSSFLWPALIYSCHASADNSIWDYSGRLLVDIDRYEAFFSKDAEKNTTADEIRSLRFGASVKPMKGLRAEIKVEYDDGDDELELDSLALTYKAPFGTRFSIGKQKELLGLETSTSLSNLVTIERSMASTAFRAGKNWGLFIKHRGDNYFISGSYTQYDNSEDDFPDDNPESLTLRGNWLAYNDNDITVHLGGGFSDRDWKDNIFQIRESAEVNTADNVVRSAEFIADSIQVYNLESLIRYREFSLQSEYFFNSVEDNTGKDWHYSGFYTQFSYLINGKRKYHPERLRRIKPESKSGAWELYLRYSYLDARDNDLGATASISSLGASYQLKKFRIMFNYLYPDIEGDTRHQELNGDALSLRVQYKL